MKKYFEKLINIDFKSKVFILAANICRDYNDFCLYEEEEGIFIGIGEYISITVTDKNIICESELGVRKKVINDLCSDLDSEFKNINLDSWRAYGRVNFSLARYTYNLDIESENKVLMRFFIPKIEYRINKNNIILRSLDIKDLEEMNKKVNNSISGLDTLEVNENDNSLEKIEILNYNKEYYENIVNQGVMEIKEHKYNKVILSRKIPIKEKIDIIKTYIKGRQLNTPARSYIMKTKNLEVVGFSPETVTEVDSKRNVYTFPLAGTRALTTNLEENKKLKKELLEDTKEIAEHAVSVKLAKDELEQICDLDTVVVSDFMSVLERGTVQHIASRLKGKLREDKNPFHALAKLFPAVTASGIPKKEAIKAIGDIEKDKRDLYSGSILTYDSNGVLDAALVLRTIFQTENETWIRVGAGVVQMSKPEREFEETLEKGNSILRAITKI